ncbi:hypothetical protein [Empedobacter falsenii]|uniref:hypothetical protein n=1 Tax=Empedobacter falsenii TaxID=343874 RepID=UPI002574EAF5|nr:hypothetical protein [Empedobacter falsenii]MDM1318139.1 hypothetical protein [Empedobacter falsenii]
MIEELFNELNQADLLSAQQKLIKKLEKKPFEISKKTSYEPLYELLQTLFITEHPDYKFSRAIAQIFFDNEVKNIHSGYHDFRYSALMYLSFLSNKDTKANIFNRLTENADPNVHQSRMKRFKEEVILNDVITRFKSAKENTELYYAANKVIFASLQILAHLPESEEQITRLNLLISEMVTKQQQVLQNIKTI